MSFDMGCHSLRPHSCIVGKHISIYCIALIPHHKLAICVLYLLIPIIWYSSSERNMASTSRQRVTEKFFCIYMPQWVPSRWPRVLMASSHFVWSTPSKERCLLGVTHLVCVHHFDWRLMMVWWLFVLRRKVRGLHQRLWPYHTCLKADMLLLYHPKSMLRLKESKPWLIMHIISVSFEIPTSKWRPSIFCG